MDDDKIKSLFADFNPELSSDTQFMARLQRTIEAVEFMKQQNAIFHKRNKTAVVVAALAGFIVGVLTTLIFSAFGVWTSLTYLTLPFLTASPITIDFRIINIILTAAVSCFTVYNAYVVALSKLCNRQKLA